jgi:hypothetical protein
MVKQHRFRFCQTFVVLGPWLLLFAAGCGDVDWNWDLAWWEKPKRVVRPIRPQPQQDRTRSAQTTTQPAADQPAAVTQDPQARPAPARAVPERAAQRATAADTATGRIAPPSNPPPMNPPPGDSTRADLPFYQLYLAGGDQAREEQPGERRLNLRNANPRACASLIEMLYVPMGRSGSADECYLIYESPAEFEAAIALVPTLDLPALNALTATVGAGAAFKTGVSQMLFILAQGAVVDSKLIDDCERHLVEALQSTQLSAPDRWVAGIMAGRLASEFKYDYPSAKSYLQQAQQASAAGSMEQMTALWWSADSLVQEGKAAEARDVYQRIVRDYSEWKSSQIVRRSQARLDDRRKR